MKAFLRSTGADVAKREEYFDSTASIRKEKRMKVKQRGLSGWQRLSLRALSLLAVLMFVLAGSLVLRGTAHAQSATVTVNSEANLVGRVFLDVSGTNVCGPLPPNAFVENDSIVVTVFQAAGRDLVTAGAAIIPICDGMVHTYQVEMSPIGIGRFAGPGLLFHGGPAFARASLLLQFFNPVTGQFVSESAVSGLVSINITG